MKKVFKFKEFNGDVSSFLNWLEWNYKMSSSSDVDEWDSDESYFWNEESLELVLYNEEFDMEENGDEFEYYVYVDMLRDNMK